MLFSRRVLRSVLAGLLVAVVAAAAGAPAQASDRSLKRTVAAQEKKLTPLREDLSAALERFVKPFGAVPIERFNDALARLQQAERGYARRVVNQKASSRRVKRARSAMIAARRSMDRALLTYDKALQQVFDEQQNAAVATLVIAKGRLKAADRRVKSAARRLNVRKVAG